MAFSIRRKKTSQIAVGKVRIGGEAPVVVQSMTNTKTQDIGATVDQIRRLEACGCEVVRVAVPDEEAARAIRSIRKQISIPLIADVHFDYQLAILSVQMGADGLRINPGNIGGMEKVKRVVSSARSHGVPIRIGVNSGSLEKDILEKYKGVTAEAMVESAMGHIRILEDLNFNQIKVSLKASDVSRTIDAYRLLSSRIDYPLHVGITEAGSLYSGIVKSSIGVGMLLAEGIGDTIRISLTRDPAEEVRVGYEILKSLGIRHRGPEIISCPTCGRCNIDLFRISEEVESALLNSEKRIKIAIMGCVVNGPGEAREADIGIAGGDGKAVLFRKGRVVRSFPQEQLVSELLKAVEEYDAEDECCNRDKTNQ